MSVVIETRDLTKVFPPNIVAVNRVSMKINEGEIFAFLGPNGAGKTTTVRLLACLLTPTAGTAVINGYEISQNALEVRRNLGILTDRPNLYPRLTARRNLLFYAKMYGLSHEEASRRIESLSRQFELTDRLNSAVGSFSKGMKQKLGILRSMIHNPEILFFDEPTSGLDPIAARTVRDTIEITAKELSTTIFLTTHNLPEAERLADKIGVINKGEIITLGSTLQLKEQITKIKRVLITCLEDVSQYRSELEDIEGITSVSIIEDGFSLELDVEDIEQVIPKSVRLLVSRGASIVKVEPYKTSLEDVYQLLKRKL